MKETYEVGPGRTVVITVEVTGTSAEVAKPDYPSEMDWAAVRAERDGLKEVVSRREHRIAELERTLAGAIDREAKLEDDLHRSEQSVRARDNLLEEATFKIEQARDLLGHDQVTETRNLIVTTSGVYLADVIGQALDTLA